MQFMAAGGAVNLTSSHTLPIMQGYIAYLSCPFTSSLKSSVTSLIKLAVLKTCTYNSKVGFFTFLVFLKETTHQLLPNTTLNYLDSLKLMSCNLILSWV